jgi:hypothetical protein
MKDRGKASVSAEPGWRQSMRAAQIVTSPETGPAPDSVDRISERPPTGSPRPETGTRASRDALPLAWQWLYAR